MTGVNQFRGNTSIMSLLLGTSLAVAVPWIFSLRRSSFSWSTAISILLLIHSLFALHTLLAKQPPNLFSTLQIPLNTPTDTVRALLLRVSSTPDLDPELGGLLERLASFEARTLYLRFGHNVLATCTYCRSTEDFALYALPRAVLSYIREITFVGVSPMVLWRVWFSHLYHEVHRPPSSKARRNHSCIHGIRRSVSSSHCHYPNSTKRREAACHHGVFYLERFSWY